MRRPAKIHLLTGLSLLALVSVPTLAYAQTAFEKGTKLIYENLHTSHIERLEIEIIETWENGMTWHYTYYDRNLLSAEGIDTIPFLDLCTTIASWEIPEEPMDESCDFWFAPDQLRALKANNKTYFKTSRAPQKAEIRVELPQHITYAILVDGVLTEIPAIQTTSTAHETYVILDDESWPLILSSTDGNFRLTQIKHDFSH